MTLQHPDTWWFRALHYGGPHVVLWIAVLPDATLHVRSELHLERSLIGPLAAAMRAKTLDLNIQAVRYTVADKGQLLGKTSKDDDGETRADTFRAHQIVIRDTTHDPVQGWTRIGELLGSRPDGRPWLTIHPSCVHLIRALTNAVSDPAEPEAVLESATDQALRALRVGVMSRPAPKPFQKPPLPKEAVGHLLNDLIRAHTKSRVAWR